MADFLERLNSSDTPLPLEKNPVKGFCHSCNIRKAVVKYNGCDCVLLCGICIRKPGMAKGFCKNCGKSKGGGINVNLARKKK